jgi:hypothetical protein
LIGTLGADLLGVYGVEYTPGPLQVLLVCHKTTLSTQTMGPIVLCCAVELADVLMSALSVCFNQLCAESVRDPDLHGHLVPVAGHPLPVSALPRHGHGTTCVNHPHTTRARMRLVGCK